MRFLSVRLVILLVLFLTSCSTAPKRDEGAVSAEEARAWLGRYCSKGPRALNGSLIFKAKTKEFKGQHPGSLRFEPGGGFTLEVTHILGGTLMRLTSDGRTYSLEIPTKPRFNRKDEARYLGIDLPILRGLLLGDLPCPYPGVNAEPVEVSGATIRLKVGPWIWVFSRAEVEEEKLPFEVELLPAEGGPAVFVLSIEEWDQQANYAKKVKLTTPEGELKWVWRNRSL
jgi:hypothetical protein